MLTSTHTPLHSHSVSVAALYRGANSNRTSSGLSTVVPSRVLCCSDRERSLRMALLTSEWLLRMSGRNLGLTVSLASRKLGEREDKADSLLDRKVLWTRASGQ